MTDNTTAIVVPACRPDPGVRHLRNRFQRCQTPPPCPLPRGEEEIALAPTVPGAALFEAHDDDPALAGLEIALKGGQMGAPDHFLRIKAGGG